MYERRENRKESLLSVLNSLLSFDRCANFLSLIRVLVSSLLAGILLVTSVADAASEEPNIVIIMADDMGWECVSAYREVIAKYNYPKAKAGTKDHYRTPHIDQLAAGGMRFDHSYSQPICTPSRVQMMTGIYNQRNYIKFGLLDPKARTFGHVMKSAGYKTCVVGKWQLLGGMEGPNKFGFDEYCLWQLTRRPSRYPNPGMEVNGKPVDYPGKYGPDIASDYLCDFIGRNKDRPFFGYYPMILPHWPFEPTPDSKDWDPKSKGAKLRKTPSTFARWWRTWTRSSARLSPKLRRRG